jgi:putative aldouronate transport system substrate-binding protein
LLSRRIKMKTGRQVLVFLLALLLAGTAWAGGRRDSGSRGGAVIDRSNFNTLGTYPLVKQKETITVMTYDDTNTGIESNYLTSYYENKTNVHVNWVMAPSLQFKERVNLALAGNEPIDLVIGGNNGNAAFTGAELLRMQEQKLIVPIQDLIDSDTIWFKKNLDGQEGWREAITMSNGDILLIPSLNDCYHCMFYARMFVNKEFLKNLNLAYPTTIDEFRNMLLAFKNQDANGNGDANDEIPMQGAYDYFGSRVDTFLMSAFVYDDGENRLYLDNGKVVAAFTRNEFQDGLRYLNGLYAEGLIARDSFVVSRSDRAKQNSSKYESIIGAIPGNLGSTVGTRETGEQARWIDYEPIPPLKGPKGLQIIRRDNYNKFQISQSPGFIPVSSKNPALIMRWLDWFMTEEGTAMIYFGPKNISWVDADPGAVGPNGEPAAIKPVRIDSSSPYYNNATWGLKFPKHATYEFRNLEQVPPMYSPDGSGRQLWEIAKCMENLAPYGLPFDMEIPPLYYSSEDALEMASLASAINIYVEESIAKFIVGDLNPESGWQAFQSNLKNLGIDRYLEIIQNTYQASSFAKKK